MLSLPPTVRIFLCTQPADMRRSFDGLAGMVEQFLGCDPLSGHLFVFRNRRGDRLKVLYFDRDGMAIWYKRLEEGTFVFPQPAAGSSGIEVKPADLAMLLDGVDPTSVKRRRRWQRPVRYEHESAARRTTSEKVPGSSRTDLVSTRRSR